MPVVYSKRRSNGKRHVIFAANGYGNTLGLLGEARVNVLMVNLALDGLLANGKDGGRNAAQTAQMGTTPPR